MTTDSLASVPDVTVITPAYNAMPYIRRTLQSLVEQTIGHDSMEVVIVDDGSSDGTGEELDRWSDDYPGLFRIVHQEPSGGPAGPRNVALDLARGRYVFFLDADDYLGVESLARLVAMADENDSDIVLGKMVGLGGRGVAQSMFRKSVADADLFSSRVWWTLSVLKLYRRSLIEENGLRFPTEFRTTSDQPFAGLAYLRAGKISVDADYDHYYVVRRDDGAHVTKSGNVGNRLDVYEWMCAMVAREIGDEDKREYLLSRHFSIEFRRCLRIAARHRDPALRKMALERVGALVRTYLTPTLAARLNPRLRVALYLAGQGLAEEMARAQAEESDPKPFEILEEDGLWYARMPYFRDPAVPVPDHLYDVTGSRFLEKARHSWRWEGSTLVLEGSSSLDLLPVAVGETVEVVAHRRHAGDVTDDRRVTARRTPNGLDARLDLARLDSGGPISDGDWDLFLMVARPTSTRIVRITTAAPARGAAPTEIASHRTATCRRGPHAQLTVSVASRPKDQEVSRRLFRGLRSRKARLGMPEKPGPA